MRIDRIKFVTELMRRDLTLLTLAKLSGVSRATLSAIKTGKSCAPATASKIAKALDIDVLDIIEL